MKVKNQFLLWHRDKKKNSTVIQVTTLGVHWGEGREAAPGGRGGKGGTWGRGGCGRPDNGQIEMTIQYRTNKINFS